MTEPVAKDSDHISATDSHIVLVQNVPTPTPLPFDGIIDDHLSDDVYAENRLVACHGTTATNTPPHVAPGGTFQTPPSDQGTVIVSERSVYANSRRIARNNDTAETCNDPADAPVGRVVANSTVYVGR